MRAGVEAVAGWGLRGRTAWEIKYAPHVDDFFAAYPEPIAND